MAGRLWQEPCACAWVGLAESSLATEWVPGGQKWSRAVGEAGRAGPFPPARGGCAGAWNPSCKCSFSFWEGGLAASVHSLRKGCLICIQVCSED